jgi:hypothetical protein
MVAIQYGHRFVGSVANQGIGRFRRKSAKMPFGQDDHAPLFHKIYALS